MACHELERIELGEIEHGERALHIKTAVGQILQVRLPAFAPEIDRLEELLHQFVPDDEERGAERERAGVIRQEVDDLRTTGR